MYDDTEMYDTVLIIHLAGSWKQSLQL